MPTGNICFVCGGGSVGVEVASTLTAELEEVAPKLVTVGDAEGVALLVLTSRTGFNAGMNA